MCFQSSTLKVIMMAYISIQERQNFFLIRHH